MRQNVGKGIFFGSKCTSFLPQITECWAHNFRRPPLSTGWTRRFKPKKEVFVPKKGLWPQFQEIYANRNSTRLALASLRAESHQEMVKNPDPAGLAALQSAFLPQNRGVRLSRPFHVIQAPPQRQFFWNKNQSFWIWRVKTFLISSLPLSH